MQERSVSEENIYNLESKIRQLERSLRDVEYQLESSKNEYKIQTDTQINSLKMTEVALSAEILFAPRLFCKEKLEVPNLDRGKHL